MATVRYRVDGVPPQWVDAWFPMPTLTPAAATSISWTIFGAPGTEPVPSPRPAGSMTLSKSPDWHPPSAVAPDYINPQLCTQDIRYLKPPVHYLPLPFAELVDPVTPIGSHGPLGPPPVVMGGRKVGGRRSMHWPRVLTSWPALRGDR